MISKCWIKDVAENTHDARTIGTDFGRILSPSETVKILKVFTIRSSTPQILLRYSMPYQGNLLSTVTDLDFLLSGISIQQTGNSNIFFAGNTLNPKILTSLACYLAKPLSKFFNDSLAIGIIAVEWKSSIICPNLSQRLQKTIVNKILIAVLSYAFYFYVNPGTRNRLYFIDILMIYFLN